MTNCIMLVGIPGIGKSTFAKTLFDYPVVSSDEIRKRLAGSLRGAHDQKVSPWDQFYLEINENLRDNVDTIADATFLTRRHRNRLHEITDKYEANLHVVMFSNEDQAVLRNSQRNSDEQVPEAVMNDMLDLYQDTSAVIQEENYASVTRIEYFARA